MPSLLGCTRADHYQSSDLHCFSSQPENTRDSKNHDEPLSNTSSSPGTEPTNIMQLKKQQPFQDPFAASSLGLHCHGPVPSLGSSKYYGHVYGGKVVQEKVTRICKWNKNTLNSVGEWEFPVTFLCRHFVQGVLWRNFWKKKGLVYQRLGSFAQW